MASWSFPSGQSSSSNERGLYGVPPEWLANRSRTSAWNFGRPRRSSRGKNAGSTRSSRVTAASGRTPFTIAAVKYARARGAKTIAVVCNPKSPLGEVAHVAIVADVGAEVIAGSTRMKAGTAQKMILNMLTTGAMARLGYVYGNLMVNAGPRNEKLMERGVGILEKAVGLDRRAARKFLVAAKGQIPVALVMAKTGVSRARAVAAVGKSRGQVRRAIAMAKSE